MGQFVLKKVIVCGFRGFTSEQEFELGYPLTLVSGPNRSGKSSLLNAVEWCLFGSEVAAIKYGDIRERDRWEVRNLGSKECYVECELESRPEGTRLKVHRELARGKRQTQFWFELDGEGQNKDEVQLQVLLCISPADFLRAVHLHPEVIRDLITAKPSVRKDAIDRLLGLSDLREMAASLKNQKPKDWTDSLDQSIEDLSSRLEVALQQKQGVLDTEVKKLKEAGLSEADFSDEGSLRYARGVVLKLNAFVSEYKLPFVGAAGPQSLAEVEVLASNFPKTLQQLRSQHPVLRDQSSLLTARTRLEGIKQSYNRQVSKLALAEGAIRALAPDKRDIEGLNQTITDLNSRITALTQQMEEVSANVGVLGKALDYFGAKLPVGGSVSCPVCGQTSKTIAEWKEHLKAEIEKFHALPLQTKREELQRARSAAEKDLQSLRALTSKVEQERQSLRAVTGEIEAALGETLKDTDDPAAILTKKFEEVSENLKNLQSQVEDINRQFDGFQESGRILDGVVRIGKTRWEISQIEGIQTSQAYTHMTEVRAKCEQYAADVDVLIAVLQRVTGAEATRRLAKAQKAISEFFTRLTARPDYPGLLVAAVAEGYRVDVTSSSGPREAVPILNQGDLNCAAISIFLALATAEDSSHHLDYLILDDPSQSLDSTSKRNLAKVLETACDKKQVIMGTTDGELADLAQKLTKKKTTFRFKGWQPGMGPEVEVQTGKA
jgi:DNA repair exonuclease SbcCD ATPase subunit